MGNYFDIFSFLFFGNFGFTKMLYLRISKREIHCLLFAGVTFNSFYWLSTSLCGDFMSERVQHQLTLPSSDNTNCFCNNMLRVNTYIFQCN